MNNRKAEAAEALEVERAIVNENTLFGLSLGDAGQCGKCRLRVSGGRQELKNTRKLLRRLKASMRYWLSSRGSLLMAPTKYF